MKKRFIFTLSTVGIFMLCGCSSGTPKCDESDAKKLVLSISGDQGGIINGIADHIKYAMTLSEAGKCLSSQQSIEQCNNDARLKAEEIFNKAELINIREDFIDEKTKKCGCKADIDLKNGTLQGIYYELSYTSEGKLYAEVKRWLE